TNIDNQLNHHIKLKPECINNSKGTLELPRDKYTTDGTEVNLILNSTSTIEDPPIVQNPTENTSSPILNQNNYHNHLRQYGTNNSLNLDLLWNTTQYTPSTVSDSPSQRKLINEYASDRGDMEVFNAQHYIDEPCDPTLSESEKNHNIEQKYPRKQYGAMIRGADNYRDYLKLFGEWPENAFQNGVKVEPMPLDLNVIISNVDKSVNIEHTKTLTDLELKYGLTNVARIMQYENTPTNKIRANVKTLMDYLDVLKNGIYLQETSKKQKVLPNIVYAKVCNKCGELNHKEKFCTNRQRCLKCGSFNHGLNKCNSTHEVCLNCKGSHRCNSELCEKLNDKTFSLNKYVINLLIGEKVIVNKYDILKTKRPISSAKNEINSQESNQLDNSRLISLVNELMDKKLQVDVLPKIDSIENNQKKITPRIESIESDLSTLKENFNQLNSTLTEIKAGQTSGFESLSKLILATINASGFENNIGYINELISDNSIVCIQESWIENEKKLENSIYIANKLYFFEPATRYHTTGRASGGLAFIFDDHLNPIYELLNKRIGLLIVNQLAILNVHLIYDNGT
ncbi:unnamed protein product, partial [Brachionus calyciflorus]